MTEPWWTLALCADEHRPAGIGPEWWTEQPQGMGWGQGQQRLAVRICNVCPVRWKCLEDALKYERGTSAKYRYTVRGGYTPAQRAAMSRPRCSCGVDLWLEDGHEQAMLAAHANICPHAQQAVA